jgi:hypothetical protein
MDKEPQRKTNEASDYKEPIQLTEVRRVMDAMESSPVVKAFYRMEQAQSSITDPGVINSFNQHPDVKLFLSLRTLLTNLHQEARESLGDKK